jgi:MFS family permease
VLPALRNQNYRKWLIGLSVANIGTWMQRVAQDWLILQLTAKSGVQLGLVTGVQYIPIFLIGPIGGVLADKFPRRHLLMWSLSAIGACGIVLSGLVFTGVDQIWQVYLLAAVLGAATAVFQPTVQAFVLELVSREEVPSVVGLSGGSFHAARLIGPALAGLLISIDGTGPVFLIAGATVISPIIALLKMDTSQLHEVPAEAGGIKLLFDGFRYAWNDPQTRLLLAMTTLIGIFVANSPITSALMATTVFGKGAGGYGVLGSVVAIGSLAGAALAARRSSVTWKIASVGAIAFAILNVVSGFAPNYVTFALALIPVGLAQLTFITAANAVLQLRAAPELRGRVMALFMVLSMGTDVIGGPLIGSLAQHAGARAALIYANLFALLVMLVLLALHLRSVVRPDSGRTREPQGVR